MPTHNSYGALQSERLQGVRSMPLADHENGGWPRYAQRNIFVTHENAGRDWAARGSEGVASGAPPDRDKGR